MDYRPRRRRPVIQRRVRSPGVVFLPPLLDHALRLLQRVKNLSVQTFISQLPIKTLAVSVLPRTARFDVQRSGPEIPQPLALFSSNRWSEESRQVKGITRARDPNSRAASPRARDPAPHPVDAQNGGLPDVQRTCPPCNHDGRGSAAANPSFRSHLVEVGRIFTAMVDDVRPSAPLRDFDRLEFLVSAKPNVNSENSSCCAISPRLPFCLLLR